MKRLIALLLILTMAFALCSCLNNDNGNGGGDNGGGDNGGGEGGGGSVIGELCPEGGSHDFVENKCTKCGTWYDPNGWT